MGSGGFALFGGPGCLTRPWAAARPRAVRAASFARRVDSLSGQAPPLLSNFARNSPASTSNIEFMSLELQRFQAIFKSDRGKLCAKCVCGGRVGSLSGQAPPPPTGTAARPRRYSAISHVIPLRVLQTLNSCRWDCNVFGLSPKVTVGNYVRNVSGAGASARCPARPRPRPRAPQPGPAVAPAIVISHAIPQQLVQILNLHRWNCNVFWVC